MTEPEALDIAQKVANALDLPQAFEEIAPGRSQRLSSALARVFQSLLSVPKDLQAKSIVAERSADRPDHIDLAWALLWQAGNALLASAHLLGRGYSTEALAVARLAAERLACAVAIRDNPHLAAAFRKNKLKKFGTQAVSAVSKTVRGFGALYGRLSTFGVHTHSTVPQMAAVGYELVDNRRLVVLPIGGDYRMGVERQAWAELADYLCDVCEQLLAPATRQVFLNKRRRRAKLMRGITTR